MCFNPVQGTAVTEQEAGEEETSIFGDGILMASQGTGPLWAPPPHMAGGEQQKISQSERKIWIHI